MSKTILNSDPFPADPETLQVLLSGYALSNIVFSAVELGVFDALAAEPRTSSGLAKKLKVSEVGIERLLRALAALSLVESGEGNTWRNSDLAAAALATDGPQSIRAVVEHHRRHLMPLFLHLTDAVRTGSSQVRRWPFAVSEATNAYEELARAPEEAKWAMGALERMSVGVGRDIATRVNLEKVSTIVDLGGGTGQIAIELAEAHPTLRVLLVDQADVAARAEARVTAAGLEGRVFCIAGDVRDPAPLPESAHAVLISALLADFGRRDQRRILQAARDMLEPGGLVIISETLLRPDRRGPVLPTVLSLCMLLGFGTESLTEADVRGLLEENGFAVETVLPKSDPSGRDLIVAHAV